VLFLAAVLSAWYGSGVWFQRDITVLASEGIYHLETSAPTVGRALEAAGVVLGPRDRTLPDVDARVREGMVVEVRRAQPVAFRLDGRELRIMTAARTVGEALENSRLPIRPDDRLEPGRDTPVTAGLRVVVTRVVRSYQHREDQIPFETIKSEDMTMELGQSVVVAPGEPGNSVVCGPFGCDTSGAAPLGLGVV